MISSLFSIDFCTVSVLFLFWTPNGFIQKLDRAHKSPGCRAGNGNCGPRGKWRPTWGCRRSWECGVGREAAEGQGHNIQAGRHVAWKNLEAAGGIWSKKEIYNQRKARIWACTLGAFNSHNFSGIPSCIWGSFILVFMLDFGVQAQEIYFFLTVANGEIFGCSITASGIERLNCLGTTMAKPPWFVRPETTTSKSSSRWLWAGADPNEIGGTWQKFYVFLCFS